MELIKLKDYQIEQFIKGELIYIDHPEKGMCLIDLKNVHVGVIV